MHTCCKSREIVFFCLFVRGGEIESIKFFCFGTFLQNLIKLAHVEPPLWIRNVTIARFIIFHLFDIRQDTFLFFWLLEETCLLFFHELIFSKLPLLLTCVSRPEMYSDSNLGTVLSQQKVCMVFYCAILLVLTL